MNHNAYDYILVGGGLQSGLLSLAITATSTEVADSADRT